MIYDHGVFALFLSWPFEAIGEVPLEVDVQSCYLKLGFDLHDGARCLFVAVVVLVR